MKRLLVVFMLALGMAAFTTSMLACGESTTTDAGTTTETTTEQAPADSGMTD